MTEINPQLLKGTLDGALLLVIGQGETYGYEITEKLEKMGFLSIAAGTIYPILQKLERTALISGEMRASSEGPKRKYFTPTIQGEAKVNVFLKCWVALSSATTHPIPETRA